MKRKYTISVFTENMVGLLNRITIIFSRRKINIESIVVSESEVENIHRYTIVIAEDEEAVKRIVLQLEKQIEIIKVVYHVDEEMVSQEIALYKIPTNALISGKDAGKIIRTHHARVLSVEPKFTVLEKTGHKSETQALFYDLEPFGILEFMRSGQIAITKPMRTLTSIVEEQENIIKQNRNEKLF